MTRMSEPGGAAPYSAALISLSVPSTPTRSTWTRTPRPPGISSRAGRGRSARWSESARPGWTAMAFKARLLGELAGPREEAGEEAFHAGREAGAVVRVRRLFDGLGLRGVGVDHRGEGPEPHLPDDRGGDLA